MQPSNFYFLRYKILKYTMDYNLVFLRHRKFFTRSRIYTFSNWKSCKMVKYAKMSQKICELVSISVSVAGGGRLGGIGAPAAAIISSAAAAIATTLSTYNNWIIELPAVRKTEPSTKGQDFFNNPCPIATMVHGKQQQNQSIINVQCFQLNQIECHIMRPWV